MIKKGDYPIYTGPDFGQEPNIKQARFWGVYVLMKLKFSTLLLVVIALA